MKVFMVLGHCLPYFCFEVHWQPLLHEGAYMVAELAVAICDRKEVGVLQVAKVRHCDPRVLVYLVRV